MPAEHLHTHPQEFPKEANYSEALAKKLTPEAVKNFTMFCEHILKTSRHEVKVGISPEDLFQQTVAKLLQQSASFPEAKNDFKNFFITAIRNCLVDFVRAGTAQKRSGSYQHSSIEHNPENPKLVGPKDLERDTHIKKVIQKFLGTTYSGFPKIAEVYNLCYEQGMSLKEAAAKLNTTSKTVKRNKNEIKKIFKELGL